MFHSVLGHVGGADPPAAPANAISNRGIGGEGPRSVVSSCPTAIRSYEEGATARNDDESVQEQCSRIAKAVPWILREAKARSQEKQEQKRDQCERKRKQREHEDEEFRRQRGREEEETEEPAAAVQAKNAATKQSTRQTCPTTAGTVVSSDPSAPKRNRQARSFCGPTEHAAAGAGRKNPSAQRAEDNNALDVMDVDALDEEKMRTFEGLQQRGKGGNGCKDGCGCLVPGSFLPPGVEEQAEQARGLTAMQSVGETVAGPERGGEAPAQATQSGERGGRGGRPEAHGGDVGFEENAPPSSAVGVTASDAIRSNGPGAFKQKPIQTTQNTGCKCKKSGCLKKYCACFRAGSVCGAKCKCAKCKNTPGYPQGGQSSKYVGASVTEGGEEVWDLRVILTQWQITHPNAPDCATDGCNRKACGIWFSNLDLNNENPSFSCLNCGPWPDEPDEIPNLPIKVLTDEHKDAIIAKCSSLTDPPPLPDLPSRLDGVAYNIAGGTFHEVCITNHGPLGVGSCPEENSRKTRIDHVVLNSLADRAGLQQGDIPVSNGLTVPFHTFQQLCQRRPFAIRVLRPKMASPRKCSFDECEKNALSGGLCGSHGGGTRCSFDECDKLVLSGGLCGTHGGGKRCSFDECDKRIQIGCHGYCIGHFNLVDLAGDANKVDMLVESVSQMLPKLSFGAGSSSDSIQNIAHIYSEGCKGMLSGHVIAQQILEQVERNAFCPCSERFFGYTDTKTVGKKRTLILIYIRVSPKTNNTGYIQIIRIIVAIYLLQARNSTEIYEVYPIIFAGMEVDRRKSFESDGVHRLFDKLLRIPEDTNVLVVANEALRVSSESHQVKTFESTVKALHSGAKCTFLDQLGLDHDEGTAALDALIAKHAEINEVATHSNPGKSVPIGEGFDDERRLVEERASRICEDIASFEGFLTEGTTRGVERPREDEIAQSWRDICNRISGMPVELQDEAIRREAANFVLLGNTGSGGKHAIYHRTSSRSMAALMEENDLPIDQVSRNLAMIENVHEVDFDEDVQKFPEQLEIFHDKGCARGNLCNHQFAKLLAAIIRGELDSVVCTEPNRPTNRLLHVKLLHAVCELKGTKIFYSKCIGQDEFAIAQAEEDRNAEMSAAREEYNELIEDLRKAIADEDLRALSYVFRKLSDMMAFPGIDPPKEWKP